MTGDREIKKGVGRFKGSVISIFLFTLFIFPSNQVFAEEGEIMVLSDLSETERQEVQQLMDEAKKREGEKDFESSLKIYQYIISLYGPIFEIETRYAKVLGWAGRFDESIAIFDRLIRKRQGELSLLFDRAKVLLWKGDIERAQAEFISLRDSTLHSTGGKENDLTRLIALYLGRCYREKSDFISSLNYYKIYLERFSSDLDARVEYAKTLSWAGFLSQAEEEFEEILKVDPTRGDVITGLALINLWAGDYWTSYHYFKRAEDSGYILTEDERRSKDSLTERFKTQVFLKDRFFYDSDDFLFDSIDLVVETSVPPLFKLTSMPDYSFFYDNSSQKRGYVGSPGLIMNIERDFGLNLYAKLTGGFRYHTGESVFLNPVLGATVSYRFSQKFSAGIVVDGDDAVFDVTSFPSIQAGLFLLNFSGNISWMLSDSSSVFLYAGRGEIYPERNSRYHFYLEFSNRLKRMSSLTWGLILYDLNYLDTSTLYWDPLFYSSNILFVRWSPWRGETYLLDLGGGLGPAYESRQDGSYGFFLEYFLSSSFNYQIKKGLSLNTSFKYSQTVREGYYRSLTTHLYLCYKF